MSDESLLTASAEGDQRAFSELYERHARSIYNYLFRRLADWSEAEDLFTRNPAQDGSPSWSPDGRRIAFVSDRDGRLEAHVMNADGSGQRSLTSLDE